MPLSIGIEISTPRGGTFVSGGSAPFVSDSFTGADNTDLISHVGEMGATWARVTGVTGSIKITANRCKGDSGGTSLYYANGSPLSAEYDVQAVMTVISSLDEAGLCARMSTSAQTYYRAWWKHSAGKWAIDKVIAGVITELGGFPGSTPVAGTGPYTLRFEVRNATKKLFIDGTERISTNDNEITSAGKAGLVYLNSDWGFGTTGRPMDTFVASNP